MEPNNVRLAPRTSRVPLDDVLIELQHEDFDDRFDADGVNVGLGGLSMRAAILPDVGSRIRCSFQSPADGEHVEAGCEVVWAADSGRYMGEFGLRFVEVDTRSALALRKLVAGWSEHAEADSNADPDGDFDQDGDDHHEEQDEVPAIELRLDGVASPLVAELVEGSDASMVVEQELPFLRLGTGVEAEDGRRGQLHSVDLRLDGELPRLVLTVRYDDRGEPDEEPAAELEARAVAEVEDEADGYDGDAEPATGALHAAGAQPSDPLDTIPDAPAIEPEFVAHATGDGRDEPETVPGLEAAADEDVGYGGSAEFSDAYRAAPEPARVPADVDHEDAGMPRGRDLVGDVRARLVPAVAAFRAYVLLLWARLVPAARRAADRARRAAEGARAQGAPMLERSASRLVSTARRFVAIFRERAAAQDATKRRPQTRRVQTSRAMARAAREEAQSESAPVAKQRKALLGAVTLAVLVLGVYAVLAPESAIEPAPEAAAAEASPAAPPAPSAGAYAAPAASAYGPAPSAYGAPAPSGYAPQAAAYPTPVPAPAAQPEVPRALPEPDYQAGPIPAPTYPAIGDQRPSPAADPVSAGGQSFGAASVPDGTPFTLNMSTPIGAIFGEATEWGFIVRIPGSLSLSRASPIAQNHPHVERAAIRNLGDSAELTIRFVEGRSPAYRVEARGTRLVVIVGR